MERFSGGFPSYSGDDTIVFAHSLFALLLSTKVFALRLCAVALILMIIVPARTCGTFNTSPLYAALLFGCFPGIGCANKCQCHMRCVRTQGHIAMTTLAT